MKRSSKPRLALFGYGILGGGTLRHGIPVLKDLFGRLSHDFEIVYYCFVRIEATNVPPNITVRQVTNLPLPGRLKLFLLSVACAIDHIRNPFSLLFAVAIYPTGLLALGAGKIFRIPVVVTEAMCCGVVVCGTKVGLLYDEPSCCIEVDVKDYVALAQQTLELIGDEPRFREIQKNALAWATSHSILWTVEKLKACYGKGEA